MFIAMLGCDGDHTCNCWRIEWGRGGREKTNRIKAKHLTQVIIQFLCIKHMRQLT